MRVKERCYVVPGRVGIGVLGDGQVVRVVVPAKCKRSGLRT